jgi:DHA2 family multidrug resistance protein
MDEAAFSVSPARRTLITILMIGATVMVVLDSTIANVALPHMRASLGASNETISWVLTSYILASAVAMPLTGWLAERFGRRALFTVAIAGFTASSALCGLSNSLVLMVVARLLQGVFGAFIVPMSQAVMYDINPPENHVRAMTIWGMAIMIGPIMGPVLGGYLTDSWNWRWVFFINVPIGLVASVAAWILLPSSRKERRPFDMLGFLLLTIALGSLQLMLDRGTQLDWFSSSEIVIEAGIAVAAFWAFAVHMATAPHPLVPIALFRNSNFVASILMLAVAGGIMMAGAALAAPMLQQLLGYSVYDAGLLIMPRGVGTVVGMVLAGRLAGKIDSRLVIGFGMLLLAWSLHMMTGFNLMMGSGPVIRSGVIQGFGLGLVVMPLNLLAFATLASALRTEGAAVYSLARNIGASIAISAATALIASNLQTSHADLGAHITASTMPIESGAIEQFGARAEVILAFLDLEINRQALMIAYLDDFWLMMWAAVLAAPLVLVMRSARPGAKPIPMGE